MLLYDVSSVTHVQQVMIYTISIYHGNRSHIFTSYITVVYLYLLYTQKVLFFCLATIIPLLILLICSICIQLQINQILYCYEYY